MRRIYLKHILLCSFCVFFLGSFISARGQSHTVNGVVQGNNGEALPGVTVLLKDTQNGVSTDLDGRYTLTGVPEDGTLVFSFIGFISREIPVNGESTLDVVLQEDLRTLDEVVVVGYGTQKRQNLTGSVATVDAEELTDITSPNVGNLLQGKVAGVDVVTNTGMPGAQPTIRIRGRSSIRSSVDPIWVVDGVIMHGVPNLNPQDIESISVLKDAAAAALYGSRGANGVVVVTTKSAKGGEESVVTLSTKTGVSLFNSGGFKLSNSQQLYDIWGNYGDPDKLPDYYNESLLNNDTDWVDLGTQTGLVQDYNLSYRGSAGKTRIYTTANYFKEEGSVKGYLYERFSARLNLDHDINEKLTFRPKIAATYTETDDRQHKIRDMYRGLPWDNPFDDEGNVRNPQQAGVTWYGRDKQNYLYDLQWNFVEANSFNILTNLDFNYDITDHLSFISTNNITYYNSESLGYTDPRSNAGLANIGLINNSTANRITRFTNQMLSYRRTSGRHSINSLVAYEYSDYTYDDISASAKGLVPGMKVLSATSEPMSIEGTKNQYAFQSVLFNANYGFDDRYNLQFSFRRDGASRFGANQRYGNFISVSGAWNIHEEAFFNSKSIDFLRFKTAYGGVGNTPESLYPQYELYSLTAHYNGVPSAVPSSLGNDNLSWEKTYDTNIGVEIGLFNRMDLTVEAYNKNTTDLLHFVPLPTVSGFTGYYDNIGGVRNRGIEILLGMDVIQSQNLTWRLDFNFGRNVNEITHLFEGRRQISGNKIIEEGQDIDTYYMRNWAGVNPADGTPQWEVVIPETGEVRITSSYAEATLQRVGNATPDFFGGFRSSLRFKGLYLNANLSYSVGATVYNAGREIFDGDGAYPTYNQIELRPEWSRWTPENPNATHPQAFYGGNNNSHRPSSRYLEDASFLRLRNVTLGYQLPERIIKIFKLKPVDVYLSADNMLTLTKYTGLDPEAAINGDTYSPYPLPIRIMFGLNVSF